MTMSDQIAAYPDWTSRTHVRAWLTRLAREAGEYAEIALDEVGFGVRLDENGEADISHLSDADVAEIKAAALNAA